MQRHAFEQEVIKDWVIFSLTVVQLGLSCRVTGGNFLTHEINCTYEDFLIVLDLSNN